MRFLVSGASGLIGSALVDRIRIAQGATAGGGSAPDEILRLVRAPAGGDAIVWEPLANRLDGRALEGVDVVVHLAGESIARGRWHAAKKTRILESRVCGTELLVRTLAGLRRPPAVLLSASAIGYYGDRGDEEIDESSAAGHGFLAEVCRQWEEATCPAAEAGIRVVLGRIGVVLARQGGALAKMLPLFRLGLGGTLGSGRQPVSWITCNDLVRAILAAIENPALQGPVNLVAPEPVTNRRFTQALASAVRRPALLPVPALALRMAMGEMADAMLLSGARVVPRRLLAAGFRFDDPQIEQALARLVGR